MSLNSGIFSQTGDQPVQAMSWQAWEAWPLKQEGDTQQCPQWTGDHMADENEVVKTGQCGWNDQMTHSHLHSPSALETGKAHTQPRRIVWEGDTELSENKSPSFSGQGRLK